jgi:predicted AAA+ superfamily ATPase
MRDPASLARVNEGAIAEQWVGQHLLDLRFPTQPPELHYWVREKAGALAEVDYVISKGPRVYPVEVKAGASSRAKSLQVFLAEKKRAPLGVQFDAAPGGLDRERRILRLPFYLVEQLPRLLLGMGRG